MATDAKKPAVKKVAAKKPVAKKVAAKKPAAKKVAAKKPVAKKVAAKKPVAKKAAAKKPVAKKAAAKKPAAKKVAAKIAKKMFGTRKDIMKTISAFLMACGILLAQATQAPNPTQQPNENAARMAAGSAMTRARWR